MRKRFTIWFACLIAFTVATTIYASDLPSNYQALFLLRVLAYDRNLRSRARDSVSILVVYLDGNEASVSMRNDILASLDKISDAKVGGLPFRTTSAAFSSPAGFDGVVADSKATAVYVCPGLESSAITDITRKHSALSLTGIEALVKSGVSIGLVARAGKPAIIVNLAAAKAEGADLDPALLRLAELVR